MNFIQFFFPFSSLNWWLKESFVHQLWKKCQLTAHYIFTSQACDPRFPLYWSFKSNLSLLIVYIFRLQAYLHFFFTFFADGWGCRILCSWALEKLMHSCPYHQLHIKLWYIDFIHVYLQKVLSDKGLHWFRKHLYTETTAWTNTSVMIYLYINSIMLS